MLFRQRIAVLDTETTGIFGRDPWTETIEVGAVILNYDGTELASFSSLVKPTVLDERTAPAMRVNQIDPADLQRAPDPTTVACLLTKWLFDHDTTFLSAYNIKFDRAALEQLGISFDDDQSLKWASCIMETAKDHMKFHKRPKLIEAALHYKVSIDGTPHRALTDARTAANIMRAIQRQRKNL